MEHRIWAELEELIWTHRKHLTFSLNLTASKKWKAQIDGDWSFTQAAWTGYSICRMEAVRKAIESAKSDLKKLAPAA